MTIKRERFIVGDDKMSRFNQYGICTKRCRMIETIFLSRRN
jgi:hypothetical protein